MEKLVLGQFVEIDTLVRRANNVRIEGQKLLVTHSGRDLSFPIRRSSVGLVEAALSDRFGTGGGLFDGERSISMRELKSLPAFDRAAQLAVIREVDERVLDLYGITKSERRGLRNGRVVCGRREESRRLARWR